MEDLKDNNGNPEDIVMNEEEANQLIGEIKTVLTDFEMQVFELMIYSFSYREIASILDKDIKQVDNAMQRIKLKVKKERTNREN